MRGVGQEQTEDAQSRKIYKDWNLPGKRQRPSTEKKMSECWPIYT